MPWITPKGDQAELPEDAKNLTEKDIQRLLFEDQTAHDIFRASAIIFPFANAGDGRAFSWCIKARKKGYKGTIVASGVLGIDRIAYAFRCGFNVVWLDDGEFSLLQPIHLHPFTHNYQPH